MQLESRGGGTTREYLYKDGVFVITPTVKTGAIQTDKSYRLTGGQQLVIPYAVSGKMIFVEYIAKVATYFGLITQNSTNYLYLNGTKTVEIASSSANLNTNQIMGAMSDTCINVCTTFSSGNPSATIDIVSIWAEDA